MAKGILICAKFCWSPITTLITWARSYRYAKLSAIGEGDGGNARAGYFGARRPFISHNRASDSVFGSIQIPFHQPRDAATAVSAGQSRVEFQRLIVICNRLPEIPLRKPDRAAMAPGFGQFRAERVSRLHAKWRWYLRSSPVASL